MATSTVAALSRLRISTAAAAATSCRLSSSRPLGAARSLSSAAATSRAESTSRHEIPARRQPSSSLVAGVGVPPSSSQCYYSTTAVASLASAMPENLTIDKRSTCSPFYGLEASSNNDDDDKETKEPVEGDDEDDDSDDETSGDIDDDGEDDDVEDEGEEDDEWVEEAAANPLEPQYAVPLPDRLHVPIRNLPTSEEVGTIHLSSDVFGMDPIRPDLLHRVVIWQRNKKRGRRTAKTKTISEVSGSGRKVRNQKGGGVARAGHRRPAHWRGGAKAHGPKGFIQDYTTKLNKKVRKLGLKHALSQKLKEGNLILVNDLVLDTHKTKNLAAILDRYDIGGKYGASAFVLDDADDDNGVDLEDGEAVDVTPEYSIGGVNVNFKVACRNLYNVKVCNQIGGNVYDILKHEKLVMTLSAMKSLEERLSP